MIRKSFSALTTKIADEAQGLVEAIVNVTGLVDHQRDLMEVGCWGDVITKARSGQIEWPSLVWGHDWSLTTGKILDAEELHPGDARLKALNAAPGVGALRIVAQYNLATQRGAEAFSDVRFGAIKQWSVGFLSAENGEEFDRKGIRHIKSVGLWPEVSNVLVGASPGTYTAIAKSMTQSGDRKQRSHDRVDQAQAIFEHAIVSKDMGIPVLAGDEAVHNKPLADAMTAIKTLIQQELGEDEVEFDCVNRLSAIALQLQGWAMDEASEYTDYSTQAAPMGEVIQAGLKALSTKEAAVAESPAETEPEPVPDPAPEPEPEPVIDWSNPDTWPVWAIPVLEAFIASLQHNDPEISDDEILTHFGRQNTRTGQDRLGE